MSTWGARSSRGPGADSGRYRPSPTWTVAADRLGGRKLDILRAPV